MRIYLFGDGINRPNEPVRKLVNPQYSVLSFVDFSEYGLYTLGLLKKQGWLDQGTVPWCPDLLTAPAPVQAFGTGKWKTSDGWLYGDFAIKD